MYDCIMHLVHVHALSSILTRGVTGASCQNATISVNSYHKNDCSVVSSVIQGEAFNKRCHQSHSNYARIRYHLVLWII